MKIKQALKKFWDALMEEHGPFAPAPDVRKRLERLGYKFELAVIGVAPFGGIVENYDVKTPKGETVDSLFGDRAVTEQYYHDYRKAVEASKAAKPKEPKP